MAAAGQGAFFPGLLLLLDLLAVAVEHFWDLGELLNLLGVDSVVMLDKSFPGDDGSGISDIVAVLFASRRIHGYNIVSCLDPGFQGTNESSELEMIIWLVASGKLTKHPNRLVFAFISTSLG